MSRCVKVAISLPQHLYTAIEQERSEGGETRSELFRRAVETYLQRRREERAVEQYVRGYTEHPESGQESAALHEISTGGLASLEWE